MDVDYFVSTLKLDSLEDGWVDSVWENEFITVDDLPANFLESEDFDAKIQEFKGELKKILLNGSQDSNEPYKIWDSLGSRVKRLLPYIYYFIKQGRKEDADDDNRTTCLNASSLYFILLSIPGSSAYKVFRRLLFDAALESFKLSSLLRDDTSPKGKKRQNEEVFEEETDNNLFYAQKYMLAEGLNSALLDLLCLLKSFSLKDKPDSFETAVQTISLLTLVDNKTSQINFSNCQASSSSSHMRLEQLLQSLTFNAYVGLHLLAKGRLQDGNVACAELVLDNVLPALAWGGSDGNARERTTIRNNMKRFVRQCILPIAKEEGHFDSTIATLVRHLCAAAVRMTADIRRMVATTILELMSDMPNINPVLDWIILFSRSERNNHRLMSMEVLGQMLLKSGTMKQLEEALPKIIEALAARFRDISPGVCGRALNALAECCSLPSALEVIQRLFDREVSQGNEDPENPLTEGEVLITELFERMADARAGVRRYALQVSASLIYACPISYRKPILLMLRHHCLDPSSMVRKAALSSLTGIISMTMLQADDSEDVKTYIEDAEESWLRGVLPQICDRDVRVKEKALEFTWNVLMLGKASGGGMPNPNWHLIRRLEILRLLPFLSEACSSWAKDRSSLGKDLWPHISKYLEGEHQYPAWVLLSTITEYSAIPGAIFIMNYYMKTSMAEEVNVFEECTNILVMRVLGRVSLDLPLENVKQLETNLLDRIAEFLLPPSVIRPAVDSLFLISRHAMGVSAAGHGTFVPVWGAGVIQSCEQYILSALNSRGGLSSQMMGAYGRASQKQRQQDPSGKDQEEEALIKRMLTLADVALVCPGVVKNSTIAAIQCILFPPPNASARSAKRLRTPSPHLCSIAVVVLGKLCLQDARLAARVVPSLGSLLQHPPLTHPPHADPVWASLRNNVMCALSDMCRSFAQLVDPLLPRMSACLHASDTTLRENALVLLVQLLQEDYLKVRRGALFFDLLTALNDPEISVSQLASYYLGRCLSHSQPTIMYQNILPALFHYNGYQGHETYKVYTIDSSGRGSENIFHSTSEEDQMEERQNIFRFMLQHINDDQRQKIIGKICREVLGGVVEGTISLDCDEGCQLLADGLWMLTTEEIRPSGLKGNEEEMEEAELAAEMALVEEAGTSSEAVNPVPETVAEGSTKKKKNQFPGMQKEMLDVLLPIAVSLMQRLEQLQSPLLTNLMAFLVLTIKEYKIDVMELVSGDQKLTEDLTRNVKSFETRKH